MFSRFWLQRMLAIVPMAALVAYPLVARAASNDSSAKPDPRLYEKTVNKAVAFLRVKGQAPDGSFTAASGPGVTALVTTALLRSGLGPDDPFVAKSLKYLEGFIQPSGGVHPPESLVGNYETCLAVMCFTEANRDGRYAKVLKNADRFLKGIQWDETEGIDRANMSYGGAGYGTKKRPDLSNTQFLVEALKATGNGPDDEAIKKALVFVSRCQNLETEHNPTQFATKNPDGGFYYTVAAGGSSMAGETPEGGLRSYASMTYAGLKSMIYAGVGPDDPRVKAAFTWAQKHYDLASNPGMGTAGLYYYYQTFAKALSAMGVDRFKDARGVEHDWRAELVAELAKRQRADGAWVNDNTRWMEGDPNLVTGYALLSLTYCRPAKK
ncbi:MAG: prenyltransferase/squalene oxidase repeat-containing protein [Pirellulales bacterium]